MVKSLFGFGQLIVFALFHNKIIREERTHAFFFCLIMLGVSMYYLYKRLTY